MSAVVLTAGRLQVGFEHRGDRYAHWIEIGAGGDGLSAERWLESLEGTASEPWPASPALQSLHVEERSHDVRVALLVGMAGGSHWSMSVEADAARGELTFDVACRRRQTPTFLGSRYQVALPDVTPRRHEGRWQIVRGGRGVELELDETAGPVRAEWQSDQLTLAAAGLSEAAAATVRWRYRVRLAKTVA